jgi:hypothetical protein
MKIKRLAVMVQRMTYRGDVLPVQRISGRTFSLKWDEAAGGYVQEVADLQEANFLLEHLGNSQGFIAGVVDLGDAPEKKDAAPVAPKRKSAPWVPTKVIHSEPTKVKEVPFVTRRKSGNQETPAVPSVPSDAPKAPPRSPAENPKTKAAPRATAKKKDKK